MNERFKTHLLAFAGLSLLTPAVLGEEPRPTAEPALVLAQDADRVTTIRIEAAPLGSTAWLLATDRPADLVIARARLEGRRLAAQVPEDLDVVPFALEADGTSVLAFEGPLRAWLQSAIRTPDGVLLFTEVAPGSGAAHATGDATGDAQQPASSYSGPGSPQTGFVVVTEFMKDPLAVSDASGEWIEVYNAGPHRYDLEGSVLSDDGSNFHLIYVGGSGLVFLPGQRLVLGANGDATANGGVPVDYDYASFTLTNSSDEIVLTGRNGKLLDRVAYDDGVAWPDDAGKSISLDGGVLVDAFLNDDPSNWCHSTTAMGPANPDTGTPRLANEVCP